MGNRFRIVLAALSLPLLSFGAAKPNVVFILVDDLGWSDVGCFGATLHETPNIDQLAAKGMRFTQAYAASPVCPCDRNSTSTV